jgi:hypothetical protein
MTPEDVERILINLKGTVRSPRWRGMGFARQRLFAVLTDDNKLFLRTSPADQAALLARQPGVFSGFSGRGPMGLTVVDLNAVESEALEAAIEMAWRNGSTAQPHASLPTGTLGTASDAEQSRSSDGAGPMPISSGLVHDRQIRA